MIRLVRHLSVFFLILLMHTALGQTGQTVQIARGSSVILRADSEHALSYLWFHNGVPINGHHDQRITVSEEGTYTVMALGNECDSDMSDPVQVIVDTDSPPIIVDLRIQNEADRPTVLLGTSFTYQVLISNNGQHTATNVITTIQLPEQVSYQQILGSYNGIVTYDRSTHQLSWEMGDIPPGGSAALSIAVIAERDGISSKIATVVSTEEDHNADDNQATVIVEIIALKIPNTFTPNGDGVNDHFVIQGLELFLQHRLVIFSRWGNEIYKSSNYGNDWDGANLHEGTYYYILEVRLHNGQWQTFKGFITIIRNTSG